MNLLRSCIFSLFSFLLLVGLTGCASQPLAESTVNQAVPSETRKVGSGIFYSSAGEQVQADYYDGGRVVLSFSYGNTSILTQVVSASGTRYVSGLEEWWEHQGEARLSRNGKSVFVGRKRN